MRLCVANDFSTIAEIINDGAQAYAGVIPPDRLSSPYMSEEHLQHELAAGVVFWGLEDSGALVGVMGIQDVKDVTLIRHAYVRTSAQGQGVGTVLLQHLRGLTDRPILIGAWADAVWAVRFYTRHGFKVVPTEEKNLLLRTYWTVPERQIETSVVLADERWRAR